MHLIMRPKTGPAMAGPGLRQEAGSHELRLRSDRARSTHLFRLHDGCVGRDGDHARDERAKLLKPAIRDTHRVLQKVEQRPLAYRLRQPSFDTPEEIRHGHIERLGNQTEHTERDAVSPALVLAY